MYTFILKVRLSLTALIVGAAGLHIESVYWAGFPGVKFKQSTSKAHFMSWKGMNIFTESQVFSLKQINGYP